LNMISNRGARVWPQGIPETFCIEQWRCRFTHKEKGRAATPEEIITLLQDLHQAGHDIIKTENLYLLDGVPGYSSAEG